MMHPERMALAALAACAILAAGCGYRAGFVVREDIRTVAVPVFANRTFYRDIEIDVTRAVIDELEKTTPYRIVHSATADAVLEGAIVRYRTPVLVEDAADDPVESEVVIAVEVTLRETATGRILSTAFVQESETFSAAAGAYELSTRPLLFRRVARLVAERAFEEAW